MTDFISPNPQVATVPPIVHLEIAAGPAVQVPNGLDQIVETFGDLRPFIQDDGTLSSRWEVENMTRVMLPFSIPLAGNPGIRVSRLECHRLLADPFLQVFRKLGTLGLQNRITSYGGCYAGRAKRTSAHWSAHAWGIAIDLNTETNAQGTQGDMHPDVVDVFRSIGFKWGGDFTGHAVDPMHFQYCTGY